MQCGQADLMLFLRGCVDMLQIQRPRVSPLLDLRFSPGSAGLLPGAACTSAGADLVVVALCRLLPLLSW